MIYDIINQYNMTYIYYMHYILHTICIICPEAHVQLFFKQSFHSSCNSSSDMPIRETTSPLCLSRQIRGRGLVTEVTRWGH